MPPCGSWSATSHTCRRDRERADDRARRTPERARRPGDFPKKTFFANSGAEAVENAVKVARYATGRQAIVCFDHAFHGRTLHGHDAHREGHAVQAGLRAVRARGLPPADGVSVPVAERPERCAEEALAYALDEMHKHIGEQNIAGVLIEPIQGEGGFIVPAPGFLKGLADFCAEHGIAFIADEIQSGMGRAGRWYAIEDEGRRARHRPHREVARRGAPDLRRDRARRHDGRGPPGRAGRDVRREPGRGRGRARGARQDRARGPARTLARARRHDHGALPRVRRSLPRGRRRPRARRHVRDRAGRRTARRRSRWAPTR